MFLVVWTKKIDIEKFTDHYLICDTYSEAEKNYDVVIKEDSTYTATIAQPLKSTEPHYVAQESNQ